MIPAIGIAVLLSTMMMGKLYPKETVIIFAIIILIVLAYPIIMNVDLSTVSSCACDL